MTSDNRESMTTQTGDDDMTKKQAQWNSKRDALIAQYGEETLVRAYRLNRYEGEGATAISAYTGIKLQQVSAACRVGESLLN